MEESLYLPEVQTLRDEQRVKELESKIQKMDEKRFAIIRSIIDLEFDANEMQLFIIKMTEERDEILERITNRKTASAAPQSS